MTVTLVADGGQMTVGRSTATYTYGSFQVVLPEGREQQEEDNRLQNGYISRPPGAALGRFDVTFVRADTTIDLGAGTSDLEAVIDAAQKRTDGDTYFDRDITGRGLGKWRPGIDYQVGDIVNTTVWTKTLPLPVTAVDMIGNRQTRAGWRVHVGGQMISDAETLRRHNDDLLQQIAREKQQRLRQVGAVQQTATEAKTTAVEAKTTADTALALVTDSEGVIAGLVSEAEGFIAQGREHVAQSAAASAESRDYAASASASATLAQELVDEADAVLAEVAGKSDEAQAWAEVARQHAVSGSRFVSSASEQSALALQAAMESQELVEQGRQILAATAADRQKAAESLTASEAILALVDAADQDVQALHTKVLGLHQETLTAHDATLTAHGQVLTLHGEAIDATSAAAAHAALAADDAGKAAAEALSATEANRQATAALREITDAHTDVLELHGRAIRAAASSASMANMAVMAQATAVEEAARAAADALSATEALARAVLEADRAETARNETQRIADQQRDDSILLHDNQLKWIRWQKPIFDYRFSVESGLTGGHVGNTMHNGLVDVTLNNTGGKGMTIVVRPGWAGKYSVEMTYTSGGSYGFSGRLNGAAQQAISYLEASDKVIRWAEVHVWPEWGVEPREYLLRPKGMAFAWTPGYENQFEGQPIDIQSDRARFMHIDVVASEDVAVFDSGGWIPHESGKTIPRGTYFRPAPGDGQNLLTVFTEVQGQLNWEPGAPISGKQTVQVARQTLPRDRWTTVASWTGLAWPSTVSAAIKTVVRFDRLNAIASTTYGTRLMVNGVEIGANLRNSLGGMNLTFNIDRTRTLKASDRIELQALCSAGISGERVITSGDMSITWDS